jgi:hypothetical protein
MMLPEMQVAATIICFLSLFGQVLPTNRESVLGFEELGRRMHYQERQPNYKHNRVELKDLYLKTMNVFLLLLLIIHR